MNVPFARTLVVNDVGPDVIAVKRALVRWDKNPDGIVINDVFGAAVELVLRRFQQQHHLHVDGIYGPGTHHELSPFFDAYGVSLIEREIHSYRNPYRDVASLLFNGYDQGVDFDGSGRVYAIGQAFVRFSTERSGWPGGGAVCYTFSAGPAKGKTVYLAENITPLVRVGQVVSSSTAIAFMHNSFPYTESGWAQDGSDRPMSQPLSHGPTYFGVNFGRLLHSLGTPCPLQEGGSDTPLPPGWPQWI